jgi:hypothetical protein
MPLLRTAQFIPIFCSGLPCKTMQGKQVVRFGLRFFLLPANQCANKESQFHGCASRIASFHQEIGAFVCAATEGKKQSTWWCIELTDFSLTECDETRCAGTRPAARRGEPQTNRTRSALIWINSRRKCSALTVTMTAHQRRIWTRQSNGTTPHLFLICYFSSHYMRAAATKNLFWIGDAPNRWWEDAQNVTRTRML